MKVFISWSGNSSRAVAEVLNDWIKCVLQASEPWISTRHIDRGSLWFSEINEKLREVSVGIVCLTQENKNKPWILFESGALAKGLTGNRVCTFLVDLEPHDLTDPLAQFNHTKPDKTGLWELVRTLNVCLGERALEERVLEKAFEVYWPVFKVDFDSALQNNPPAERVEPRSAEDVMAEILSVTRDMSRRVSKLESRRSVEERYSIFKDPPRPGLMHAVKKMMNSDMTVVDAANTLIRQHGLDGREAMRLVKFIYEDVDSSSPELDLADKEKEG